MVGPWHVWPGACTHPYHARDPRWRTTVFTIHPRSPFAHTCHISSPTLAVAPWPMRPGSGTPREPAGVLPPATSLPTTGTSAARMHPLCPGLPRFQPHDGPRVLEVEPRQLCARRQQQAYQQQAPAFPKCSLRSHVCHISSPILAVPAVPPLPRCPQRGTLREPVVRTPPATSLRKQAPAFTQCSPFAHA